MPYTFIGNDTHGGFISPGPNVLSVGIFRAGLGLLWKAEMTFLQTHHHHIKKSWKSIPFNSNMGNRESYIPRDCLQWKISLKRIQSPWLVWLSGLSTSLWTDGRRYGSQSGHMPGLWASPHWRLHKRQLHIDVSPPFFSFPSLLSRNK